MEEELLVHHRDRNNLGLCIQKNMSLREIDIPKFMVSAFAIERKGPVRTCFFSTALEASWKIGCAAENLCHFVEWLDTRIFQYAA